MFTEIFTIYVYIKFIISCLKIIKSDKTINLNIFYLLYKVYKLTCTVCKLGILRICKCNTYLYSNKTIKLITYYKIPMHSTECTVYSTCTRAKSLSSHEKAIDYTSICTHLYIIYILVNSYIYISYIPYIRVHTCSDLNIQSTTVYAYLYILEGLSRLVSRAQMGS